MYDTPASNYSARHGAPTKIEINEYLCSRLTLEEFKIGIIYHEINEYLRPTFSSPFGFPSRGTVKKAT